MIKEQCLSKEVVEVSSLGGFLDFTGFDWRKPLATSYNFEAMPTHKAGGICTLWSLSSSFTLSHYPIIYGLIFGQGI